MKTIAIDIESFSPIDLAKSGVYKYAADPGFRILLFSYSVDDGEVITIDLEGGEEIPTEIRKALSDPTVTKWAYNAMFERVCLSNYLGHWLNPEGWRCSMAWAATLGLPGSLKDVAGVLKLEEQKMEAGRDLIKLFSIPTKEETRNLPTDYPEEWELFKTYNARDVEVENAIRARLAKFPVPDYVWGQYWMDQRINDRGIRVDLSLASNARACDKEYRDRANQEAQDLTGLEKPTSPIQVKDWLAEHGCVLENLDKNTVATALTTARGVVKRVLELRQDLSKSSVKKYDAMLNVAGTDQRARGLFQFYGANRTGRWAGRLIQLQNLPRNSLPDLDTARSLVRTGLFNALELLYPSVPEALSQLVRTAFIPSPGHRFIVADYSAIEARVLAWLAGEQSTLEAFRNGEDLYCATASAMFGVPVEKHGANAELRQKGKIAVLACVAEGQPVLTDRGLVPIEQVTRHMRVWDGENYVSHEGVICKGERNVITYQDLTATPDHLVWVQGQPNPIPFGKAAASRARLVQAGDGRHPIRVGENHQPAKTLERLLEQLLCGNPLRLLRGTAVDATKQLTDWTFQRMPAMFRKRQPAHSQMARPQTDSSETTLRESPRPELSQVRGARHRIPVLLCDTSRAVDFRKPGKRAAQPGTRPDRQQWPLRERELAFCRPSHKRGKSLIHRAVEMGTKILALLSSGSNQETLPGDEQSPGDSRCLQSRRTAQEKLATHPGKARVYDIRNAGPNHRYTVSGRLVHNCGYQGAVGALTKMGALEMGLAKSELGPIVDAWRAANPRIVQYWREVEKAARQAIQTRTPMRLRNVKFSVRSGIMFITLPSGRKLAYVKPELGENQYGMPCINYWGMNQGRWQKQETYGGKLVENIVQATARDLLAEAITRIEQAGHQIVMHVHDEVVIDEPADTPTTVADICRLMTTAPDWAKGLPLDADGYECGFYKKD